jgi:HNH endonuclease
VTIAAELVRRKIIRSPPTPPELSYPFATIELRIDKSEFEGDPRQDVRQMVIAAAADLLSGPSGLASWLRTGLAPGPAHSPSLPLDIGATAETIPVHLRRAVTARDGHCRFPGCAQPPAACHPHHIIPRSPGGSTSLGNLLLLCTFHHLIAVHRWGWGITLHPDATVTATSPDRTRVLRSHGPPSQAA